MSPSLLADYSELQKYGFAGFPSDREWICAAIQEPSALVVQFYSLCLQPIGQTVISNDCSKIYLPQEQKLLDENLAQQKAVEIC